MLQNPKHPFQGGRVNTGIDNDATILSDLNYHVAARRRSGRHRIRNDHRRHKTRALPSSAFRLRAERSSPIQQKRARDAVPPRRRRDRPWRLHALQNNLELLVIRPASTSAGLNNSQPFNLSTVLIAVHKDCYTALILTRQGGPHRRETIQTRQLNRKQFVDLLLLKLPKRSSPILVPTRCRHAQSVDNLGGAN